MSATRIPTVPARFGWEPKSRPAFDGIEGLTMHSAFQGVFDCGGIKAEVVVEPGDCVRLRAPVKNPPPPCSAIAANYRLPGNLRFAVAQSGVCLLADLSLESAAHLSRGFQLLRGAVRLPEADHFAALGTASAQDLLAQAIAALDWPPDWVVRHDDAWELRPRVQRQPVPVTLEIAASHVRVHSVVLAFFEGEHAEAVAHQALRENARLRATRLATANGAMVAETLLDETMLTPRALADAVTAVAVAKWRTSTVLNALQSEPELARCYERMFAAEIGTATTT